MSVRIRRLKADYDRICSVFTGKSKIKLIKAIGSPPEKYQFEFMVGGLEKDLNTDNIRIRNNFHVEIVLTSSYPRMAPQCKMLTPVFHPNIAPHAICIGDHWSAGESLTNLIIRIGEMLSYQSYNVKSPLNGEAAQWVENNMDKLPTDDFDFSSLLAIGEVAARGEETSSENTFCANCGTQHQPGTPPFKVCLNNHVTCPHCEFECSSCGEMLCLKCPVFKCSSCGASVCHNCISKCRGCGSLVCKTHGISCSVCNTVYCPDCIVECANCGAPTCIDDIRTCETVDGQKVHICSVCEKALTLQADETT